MYGWYLEWVQLGPGLTGGVLISSSAEVLGKPLSFSLFVALSAALHETMVSPPAGELQPPQVHRKKTF